jgi:outer membrane cobalamin receptor
MFKTFIKVIAFLFLPLCAFSQDLDSLMNLSAYTEESELQKVLNQNLTVSSAKALTTRESPSIISLITAEEIQNMGARDLTDVLRMVPGFEVGQDLQFVLGIGLRGSWANEGKVLVMVDGQPFNELLYQGVAVGNRFPVDAIERIEIIRGPGSAIYGGSAEYGVINIITKAAEKLNGILLYGVGGFHSSATARTNGGISIAQNQKKISWDASFFKGKGIVSDGSLNDAFRDTTVSDLAAVANADPMNISIGLRAGGFQLRTMYDQYKTSDPYSFIYFRNFFVDAKKDFKINEKFTLTPQVKYYNQIPWQYGFFEAFEEDGTSYEAGEDYVKIRAERIFASLSGTYDVSRKVNLNFGALYFKDKATDMLDGQYFGSNTISFNNGGFFLQSLLKHRLANATIGFRYEKNNQYGDAFVPRLALTKKIENFHFKILYSQAFRAPAIENINLSLDGEIKPEKSQVFETEFGYQFTPEMLLAVNAFTLRTNDVIIYNSTENSYANFSRSGSKGIELVYSIRKTGWYSHLTYSYSQAGRNTVDIYVVPQTDKQFIGLPSHKVTLNTNINLTRKITFNPSFISVGQRYGHTEPDVVTKLDPYFLVNSFVNFRHIVTGLNAGFGVYDLLNEQPAIPQAYIGNFAAVPGRSRELIVKLSYQLNFKD